MRLAEVLVPELEQKGLTPLYSEVEMPLVPVLVAMERRASSWMPIFCARCRPS